MRDKLEGSYHLVLTLTAAVVIVVVIFVFLLFSHADEAAAVLDGSRRASPPRRFQGFAVLSGAFIFIVLIVVTVVIVVDADEGDGLCAFHGSNGREAARAPRAEPVAPLRLSDDGESRSRGR